MAGTPPASANFGVGSWIERRARIAPDKPALVGDDRSFTYAELAGREVLADIEPAALIQHAATEAAPVPGPVGRRIAVAGPIQGALAFLTWNAINFLSCADFRGDDVTVAVAPFFRVGGTGVNVLPVLFLGGTVVVPGDPSPAGILRAMERHRVTVGFGNPDLLDALARSEVWPRVDLSSVRFVVTGGAPVPERLLRAWLDRGVLLLQGYGLSEVAPLALLLDPASALTRS